ncbi:MAG: hypothetical protein QM484_06750 [Woeseiaceae bacterium]
MKSNQNISISNIVPINKVEKLIQAHREENERMISDFVVNYLDRVNAFERRLKAFRVN